MSFDLIDKKFVQPSRPVCDAPKPPAEGFGDEEGATCWRNGCQGVIAVRAVENCSCHISPPCGACTEHREYCPECDWAADKWDDTFNGFSVKYDTAAGQPWVMKAWEPRPLDPKKIDYRIRSHSNSSQICEGVYPPDTTRAQVEDHVRGTFGGRFETFGNGAFKYIAYTD